MNDYHYDCYETSAYHDIFANSFEIVHHTVNFFILNLSVLIQAYPINMIILDYKALYHSEPMYLFHNEYTKGMFCTLLLQPVFCVSYLLS